MNLSNSGVDAKHKTGKQGRNDNGNENLTKGTMIMTGLMWFFYAA
jgi:hypothetical protein